MRNTGVVYQNINRAKGILNLQEHVLAGIVVGNVCQNCHTGNAHFFQFFFRFCQLVFAARSVQHHPCACSSTVSYTHLQMKTVLDADNQPLVWQVSLGLDSNYLTLMGTHELLLETKPLVVNNRAYLPLRELAEAMNLDVEWSTDGQNCLLYTSFCG